MPKSGPPLYCVTDKELYDALVSSKQHFNANALLELARNRGIILSNADQRTELADRLSVMIFGGHELQAIQAAFDTAGRGAKTTSFRLNMELTLADIKHIAEEYREGVGEEEKVVTYNVGSTGVAVDLEYIEVDFSKTRLRQRQTKEAHIEFKIEEGHTVVTLPATEKARQAAEALRGRLFANKQTDIGLEEIDFSGINDSKLRTVFFTKLISTLPDFALQDVTRVKANRAETQDDPSDNDEDAEDNGDEEANTQMLGIVRAMALHGQSLLSSPEYQAFHKRGFFNTSITWTSKRIVAPYQLVEFDAGFEEPEFGRGFKYSVRGWATQKQGEYIKNLKPVPTDDKKRFLSVIERTAVAVFRRLKEEFASQSQDTDTPGGIE
jgi:hypothetical protein